MHVKREKSKKMRHRRVGCAASGILALVCPSCRSELLPHAKKKDASSLVHSSSVTASLNGGGKEKQRKVLKLKKTRKEKEASPRPSIPCSPAPSPPASCLPSEDRRPPASHQGRTAAIRRPRLPPRTPAYPSTNAPVCKVVILYPILSFVLLVRNPNLLRCIYFLSKFAYSGISLI
jgi:hypothetical protein